MKHVAYNIVTGDVITTDSANHLKRLVKKHNKWNHDQDYPVGEWQFAHNKQGITRIQKEVLGPDA